MLDSGCSGGCWSATVMSVGEYWAVLAAEVSVDLGGRGKCRAEGVGGDEWGKWAALTGRGWRWHWSGKDDEQGKFWRRRYLSGSSEVKVSNGGSAGR